MSVITYIANSTIPSRAANSIHVMKMCEALAELRHDVELIFPIKGEDALAIGEDSFAYYGARPLFALKLVKRPFQYGARYYFAIIAALRARFRGTELAYCRNHWAAYFCARLGIRTIFEAHAPLPDNDPRGLDLFRRLINLKQFRCLIVITHALKEHYSSHFPELAGKISVLPDAASPIAKKTVPLYLNDSGFRVGYIGQLYRGKGMELILQLAPLCPWAHFHIVGGLDSDISYWKSQCIDLPNVVFHGFVQPASVPSYLLSMDAVLLPNQTFVAAYGNGQQNISKWTSPLKAFEYMAAGKAILASDLPVLKEILRNSENALLCDPGSPTQWQIALERLRSEPGLREKLEESARCDFEQYYSWNARASKAMAIAL